MRDHHHASTSWLFVLGVVLMFVVLPRFDRHDWGFIDRFTTGGAPARVHLYDAGAYVQQVLYFRGERDEPTVSPYVYRWGVPLVASWLPLAPLTAINVVNVVLLLVGMVALWATLGLVTITPLAQVLGTALYVVSFGTFYYGAVGYVDAAGLGVLSVGMWLVVSQRWLGVAMVVAFGPFIRESNLALVPMVAVWLRVFAGGMDGLPGVRADFGRAGWLSWRWGTVAAGGVGLLAGTWDRAWGAGGGFYSLSLDNAAAIISQGEEVLKMLLSLGVAPLIILALLAYSAYRAFSMPPQVPIFGRLLAPFLAGALGAGVFVAYGLLCCNPGGRITWVVSLFLIPVAMIMLDRVVQDRSKLNVGQGTTLSHAEPHPPRSNRACVNPKASTGRADTNLE